MNSKQKEEDYVPYGPEWEKEMSKFPKLQLIKMLGKAYQEKKELKQSLPSKPVGDVEEMAETYIEQKAVISFDSDDGHAHFNSEEIIKAFKSGYAAAPQKGMRWVKASERTPTEEGDYYVKYKTGEKNLLYASGVNHHKRWSALVDEWLDESPSDK